MTWPIYHSYIHFLLCRMIWLFYTYYLGLLHWLWGNDLEAIMANMIFHVSVTWPLTHWGRMTHICVSKLTITGSDNGLSSGRHQAIIWDIVNWNVVNKLQWNLKRNSYIFIQENAFENVVCEMAAILSRPQCVKVCGLSWMVPSHNKA